MRHSHFILWLYTIDIPKMIVKYLLNFSCSKFHASQWKFRRFSGINTVEVVTLCYIRFIIDANPQNFLNLQLNKKFIFCWSTDLKCINRFVKIKKPLIYTLSRSIGTIGTMFKIVWWLKKSIWGSFAHYVYLSRMVDNNKLTRNVSLLI